MTPPKQGAAPQGGSNTSRTTRQQAAQSTTAESEDSIDDIQALAAQQQSTTGSISEIAQLRQELERARAELNSLREGPTLPEEPDRPLPTTETPPNRPPTEVRAVSEDFYADFARRLTTRRSEKTPNIDDLSDGKDPTFRQWQASIQDRLEINADHYRTERERMALVWGHTTGLAKGYLEPQYLSDTTQEQFKNAEQMVELLKSYFITGNEIAESRAVFDRLQMSKDETFALFKARFLSAAVRGQVPKSEWFHYLWTKITPSLRVPNLGFKHQWKNSFEQMVEHLTAYDMERKNHPIPSLSTVMTKPSTKMVQRPVTDTNRKIYPVTTTTNPGQTYRPVTVRLPTKTPEPDRAKTPGNCYNCGEPGHYANDCPRPRVHHIESFEEPEEFEDAVETHDPDQFRTGNGDAREDVSTRA